MVSAVHAASDSTSWTFVSNSIIVLRSPDFAARSHWSSKPAAAVKGEVEEKKGSAAPQETLAKQVISYDESDLWCVFGKLAEPWYKSEQ